MTIRSLAYSNIRGKWRSYSAFFMSCVFSVMIYYMYTAFIVHPDVVNAHMIAAMNVKQGLIFCQYIIIIFSLLFVLYSNTAFLKTRQQQFGLFTLFGMTRMQLRRLIIVENGVISALAIGVGIGLGMMFSKLFFMVLEVLLEMKHPLKFTVPLDAVWQTAGSFFVLFTVLSLWSALQVGRKEIIHMLQASLQSRNNLIQSPSLAVLAVVCLGFAYGSALILNGHNFVLLAPLIMGTVMIGTYFLFTQVSLAILQFVRGNRHIYYHRTHMIIIAQLGHKLTDNARMLFIVSMLSAVIVTASGAVYMILRTVQLDGVKTQYENPEALFSLILFIGMFLSMLFFVAAGSMIYFKLFTELRDDQAQFKALTRLGMTEDEVRKIVVTQIGIIFYAPCIVGIIHALFAMKAVDNLLQLSNWNYSLFVIGIYMAMQTIYFLVTCHDYMKHVWRSTDY
ncbi:FtsX-like permease family protein [Paenibacillus sp. 481]|uniref:FtsX-like permease family protein n=1 Tax=Paenibacillus sp. 481 TaxID=2835869 RepID=UPI001E368A0A|nr:FtsX-like permease family protein [Paenibacillus sp. 481]UHA73485.1 FtsX-like permease family protein [Paenibacillus sp. 481]